MLSRTPLQRRTPLRAKTPLAVGGTLKRSAPMRLTRIRAARSGERRSSRVIDLPRRRWIASLDCCACNRSAPSHPHHRTLTGRGKSQKSDDTECMPLCFGCHRELHALSGRFKGWTKARLDEWQRAQVAIYQGWYARLFAPASEVV